MKTNKQYKCTLCGKKSRLDVMGKPIIDHKTGCRYFLATKGEGIIEIKE
jgi:hypothetical protein